MLVAPSLLHSWRAAIINCSDQKKKIKLKSKVGSIEDKELKNCSGSEQSNWQTGLWKQRAGILKWECQGQGNSMRGDLSSQVGSEGDFLISVFFFHATRGIIKQPIVFMVNLKNIMQTATDVAIHGKVFPPNKTKNYPYTPVLYLPAPLPDGETLHSALSRWVWIVPLWSRWLSGVSSRMLQSIQASKSTVFGLKTCTLKHTGRHSGPPEVNRNLTFPRPEFSSQ